MPYYIFNVTDGRSQAVERLRARMWGVGVEEPHHEALARGDLALVYLAAPERMFIARVKLGSTVHEWTDTEAQSYPGGSPGGILLAEVEEWDPPVPMSAVLSRIDRSAGARGDFEGAVVRITADEYETALAVAAERVFDGDERRHLQGFPDGRWGFSCCPAGAVRSNVAPWNATCGGYC